MRKIRSLVLILTCLIPVGAGAQVLVVSQNKCALDKQGQIRRMTDSLLVPIAQELVNEGKLTAYGSAYHAWGDEWNVLIWYVAPSIPAFLPAFNELFSRFSQRHPGVLAQILSWCTEHKDSFYAMGKMTTPAPAEMRRP